MEKNEERLDARRMFVPWSDKRVAILSLFVIRLIQGWAIMFSMGPHEKQKILWMAGPKGLGLTQFCIILIVFLYKKAVNSIVFTSW